MTPPVAIATCADLPKEEEDDALLAAALARLGIPARRAIWDDPQEDWDAFALVVLRSTWDYTDRREEFIAWVEGLVSVLNPPAVVRWNTDKRYLGELSDGGLPVVPTGFVEPGQGWPGPPAPEYVVKPTVSAGSRDTARYGPGEDDRAAEHVASLHEAGRCVMVQPYVSSVDERGETALLYLGGSFSHGIRKGPLLLARQGFEEGLYREEDISPREPTQAEREVGERVLDGLPFAREELLYARVDLIEDGDEGPVVLEVELTEPSLFLAHGGDAADRLAGLIAARL